VKAKIEIESFHVFETGEKIHLHEGDEVTIHTPNKEFLQASDDDLIIIWATDNFHTQRLIEVPRYHLNTTVS